MEKYEKYRLQIEELLKDEAGKVTLTKKIIKRTRLNRILIKTIRQS